MKRRYVWLLGMLIVLLLLVGCAQDNEQKNTFETNEVWHFESGTVLYTIDDAYLVENLYDEGISIDKLAPFSTVTVEKDDYTYPDYVDQETGRLIGDLYLVMVELTVTNINAINTHYNDPNIFRADGFFHIYDTAGKSTGTFAYSSEHYALEEAYGTFYLGSGESKVIRVGYLFGKNDPKTLESLVLSRDSVPNSLIEFVRKLKGESTFFYHFNTVE